jgi:hypothetical protein
MPWAGTVGRFLKIVSNLNFNYTDHRTQQFFWFALVVTISISILCFCLKYVFDNGQLPFVPHNSDVSIIVRPSSALRRLFYLPSSLRLQLPLLIRNWNYIFEIVCLLINHSLTSSCIFSLWFVCVQRTFFGSKSQKTTWKNVFPSCPMYQIWLLGLEGIDNCLVFDCWLKQLISALLIAVSTGLTGLFRVISAIFFFIFYMCILYLIFLLSFYLFVLLFYDYCIFIPVVTVCNDYFWWWFERHLDALFSTGLLISIKIDDNNNIILFLFTTFFTRSSSRGLSSNFAPKKQRTEQPSLLSLINNVCYQQRQLITYINYIK